MNGDSILLVEDDKEIRQGVEIFLRSQGYQVFQAENGLEGLKILEERPIDLAIVDVMMPVMDGITMTAKLREKYDFPVIFLSAKTEEVDKILGLNIGADDYVTKPFTPMELMARVNSQLRRYHRFLDRLNSGQKENPKIHQVGGLEVNEETVEVIADGKNVKVTPIEFKILLLSSAIQEESFRQKKFTKESGTNGRSIQILSWYIYATSGKKSKWIQKIQNI